MSGKKPIVYVISDSAGETGEAVVKAAAIQFHPVSVEIRRTPFVSDREGIDRALQTAKQEHAVIVYTLVIPELRDYVKKRCREQRIVSIDLLGPVINGLEKMLHKEALQQPGKIHLLDEDYFKKVDAVEFAVKYDDGRDSSGVLKADIVLVGVSRTSKTPLSMYLAHKTYKVANVPLVPELKPPDQLFTVNNKKIIGLTIRPDKLNEIRKERLKALGLASDALYANHDRIEKEIAYAEGIMKRLGCVVIDVSTKAVEETASIILERMRSR
ncbi:pyruvate, water dikinase regulatory protein [Paenibacillus sp. y28]|uniref:pyruvate, water dikinase regulatory protein n=1 Tax=Paenibacillus sp. y28 TaxID=3129110 RepID=UPI003015DFE0